MGLNATTAKKWWFHLGNMAVQRFKKCVQVANMIYYHVTGNTALLVESSSKKDGVQRELSFLHPGVGVPTGSRTSRPPLFDGLHIRRMKSYCITVILCIYIYIDRTFRSIYNIL